MNFPINIKNFLLSMAVLFFVIYAFTTGLNLYGAYIIWATLAFSVIIAFIFGADKVKFDIGDVSTLLCIAIIWLNNNQNIARGSYTKEIVLSSIFLFYVFAKRLDNWHNFAMKLLLGVGIFYAVATVVLMNSPELYINVVNPLFSSWGDYSEQMIQLYHQGYQSGFTPHYSVNAIYLTVGFGVAAVTFLSLVRLKKSRISSIIMLVITIVLLFALLSTGKRAHVLFSVFAIVVAYYYMNSDKKVVRAFKIFFALLVFALVLVIVSQLIPSVLNVVYRFIETAEAGDVTLGRGIQIQYAMELFHTSPIFGIGWDGYMYEYEAYRGIVLNVHNVYIQLLCENGIIGSIPFFAFFIYSFKNAIMTIRYYMINIKDKDPLIVKALAFSVFIQTFFLVYCFSGNPLYDSQILYPYIFGCAINECYRYKLIDKNRGEVKRCIAQY